jgi:hypothetical protein
MRRFALIALLVLLSACSTTPLPAPMSIPGPDDAGAPSADTPYRPVMAGTADHGIGSKP